MSEHEQQAQRERHDRERHEREQAQRQAKAHAGAPAAVVPSAVEIAEADPPEKGNWLYSGPGVVPPDPRPKVWRQNRATGACDEAVVPDGQQDDRTGYFHLARQVLGGAGGVERLPSKDFPHAPTKEQEEPWDAGAPAPGPQAMPPEKTEEARARQQAHQPA